MVSNDQFVQQNGISINHFMGEAKLLSRPFHLHRSLLIATFTDYVKPCNLNSLYSDLVNLISPL